MIIKKKKKIYLEKKTKGKEKKRNQSDFGLPGNNFNKKNYFI
jgi:hypothetical protein